jgi:hypothetical protein
MITKTALAAATLLLGIGATAPAAYAGGTISGCGATANSAGTWTVTTNPTTASSTPCITITVSGVAIDLQGHMITGTGSASMYPGAGIASGTACSLTSVCQNIIIANGTIQGFDTGISSSFTEYLTIAKMNLTQNVTGLDVGENHALVTDSQASNNGGSGVILRGDNNTVTNSQANNNGGSGIYFIGNSNVVASSRANNNGFDGMTFDNPSGNDNNRVTDNQTNGNMRGGIVFGEGSGNVLSGDTANGNGEQGITVAGGDLLSGDTANGNGAEGIAVICPSSLFGNTAKGNTGTNISITAGTGCVRLGNNPAP